MFRTPLQRTSTLLAVGVFSAVVVAASVAPPAAAVKFTPSVSIPGTTFIAGQEVEVSSTSAPEYVKALYTFSVYAGSILAVVVLMVGGFLWLTAGGNVTQVGQAKTYITGALSGFVLLLLSWTLLQTVNPKLVALQPIVVDPVNGLAPVSNQCKNYKLKIEPIPEAEQSWLAAWGLGPTERTAIDGLPPDTAAVRYVLGKAGACGSAVAGELCICKEPQPGAKVCCYRVDPGACAGCSSAECLVINPLPVYSGATSTPSPSTCPSDYVKEYAASDCDVELPVELKLPSCRDRTQCSGVYSSTNPGGIPEKRCSWYRP